MKNDGGEGKSAQNGFSLGYRLDHGLLKSHVSLYRSFIVVSVFLLMFELMPYKCLLVLIW